MYTFSEYIDLLINSSIYLGKNVYTYINERTHSYIYTQIDILRLLHLYRKREEKQR